MIRLQRVGRKHEPVFRLVLTDSKNGPKSGKFLEILGHFDSRKSESAIFNVEKVKEWISKGAKLSDTVHNLLVERKVIAGKKVNNLPKKTPVIDEEALKAAEEAEKAKLEAEAKARKEAEEAETKTAEPVEETTPESTPEETSEAKEEAPAEAVA